MSPVLPNPPSVLLSPHPAQSSARPTKPRRTARLHQPLHLSRRHPHQLLPPVLFLRLRLPQTRPYPPRPPHLCLPRRHQASQHHEQCICSLASRKGAAYRDGVLRGRGRVARGSRERIQLAKSARMQWTQQVQHALRLTRDSQPHQVPPPALTHTHEAPPSRPPRLLPRVTPPLTTAAPLPARPRPPPQKRP